MKTMKCRLTFIEPILGTASNNPKIHDEFIAANAPDAKTREEEIEALGVEEVVEKSITIFPKGDDGIPFLWDYQVKGFFKDAWGMLARAKTKGFSGKAGKEGDDLDMRAYKKIVDGLIFVEPRKIPLQIQAGKALGRCQRPLRGQTAQGERIALADSEEAPEGTYIDILVHVMHGSLMPNVEKMLDYGAYRGLGQWRNSGKGRFVWRKR
jgi:hypothetical protein